MRLIAGFIAFQLLCLVAFVALDTKPANAAPPLAPLQGMVSQVGPGYVDSFSHNCTGTASAFLPTTYGTAMSYTCQTPAAGETAGTVLVAIGDSAVADPAIGTRNSPVYSGDTLREFGGNLYQEYCRSDTGTVVIYCRVMVKTGSPP